MGASLRRSPPPITDVLWHRAVAACPLAGRLDPGRQERLRAHAAWFLARKSFSAVAGAELDDLRRLLIALQATLPVLELGVHALRGWREVIVYPGEFKVRRSHEDAAGVVTEGDDVLVGEAWERGPLILSWADVASDLAQPWDGFNVVVHEIAHKLDLLDGAVDGVPELPRTLSRRTWIDAFQAAYDRHARAVERGRRTAIDAYAAEGADEFFAVVSEMHFSDPAPLARAEREVAAWLTAYYGPAPGAGGARLSPA
ncbi:MAG: zinc-dependent peptidase [Xanthomonadaceae bacterium]|nr:zinc-dependent peptidase [Xanthomonadaceae bacterium]